MTDYFVLFGEFLAAVPAYFLNGVLATLYWLGGSSAVLLSVLCAGLILRFIDPRVQSRAAFRPGRSGREVPNSGVPSSQIATLIVLGFWLAGQWGMGAPVPWLGAAMWIAGTLLLFAVRLQEHTLLWNVKSGITIYSLAILGSRWYLSATAQLDAAQWAALLGSTESAAAVIASTRGSVTTILLWALWLVIPLGYFAMLLQQVLLNPLSLVNPLMGAGELVDRYRNRK